MAASENTGERVPGMECKGAVPVEQNELVGFAGAASEGRARVLTRGLTLFAMLSWIAASGLSAQPTVTQRDSIVLEESGDDYLILPGPIVPDGTGGYLVADIRQPTVFHYSAEGRLMQRYGRKGEGPGELNEVSAALPWGDEHVLVLSWKPFAAQLFQRSNGSFVERYPLDSFVESATAHDGDLWLSGPHYAGRSAIRRLKLGDSTAEPVVRLPDEYQAGGPAGGIFPGISFARWADTLVVGFQPLQYLIVADTNGEELDRFVVPSRHRRGGVDDPEAAITEVLERGGQYSEIFGLFSLTRGVHRRPDGTFVVVHDDLRAEDPPVSTEALWVTVVDAARTRACVDGVIPLETGSRPSLGFDGDLVLVLDQVLRRGDGTTVLRRIEVEADGCDWIRLIR